MRLLISSPVGPLLAEYGSEGVRSLRFWPQGEHPPAGTRDEPAPDDSLGRQVVRELREYFAGERRDFTLPLAPSGTEFQQGVWAALRRIPFGDTRSYADLAREVGVPKGPRAVGQANGRNPIPVIVPCHRVLASGGKLGGYSSGLEVKRWLLRHEGVHEA